MFNHLSYYLFLLITKIVNLPKYNFLFYLMNNVDQYLVMLEKLQIIPEREVKSICDKVTP